MGPLTWKFELADSRASAATDYGTYLVQGQPDKTWVAALIPCGDKDHPVQVPPFRTGRHTCLSDAMRACRYHAEDASDWSGRIPVGAR